jgi:hypothetical protein
MIADDSWQLTGGGGLAGVDVADNDDVDVSLLLTVERCQRRSLMTAHASIDAKLTPWLRLCCEDVVFDRLEVLWQILEVIAMNAQVLQLA